MDGLRRGRLSSSLECRGITPPSLRTASIWPTRTSARDGLHNVYLIDLVARGSPQLIGKGARTVPVFLNTTQLWYRAEQQVPCAFGGGSPFVYDLE